MTEPVSKIKVGAFTVIGIALLLISIILFGGNEDFFHSYTTFHIYFQSTEGLAPGSVVSVSGMNVGNVKKIRLSKNLKMDVTVEILSRVARHLTSSSMASIRTQGALGDKYVYIKPGATTDPVLASDAVIPSVNESDFLDMLTSGKGPNFSKIFETVHELNQLLSSLNSDNRLSSMVSHISKASSNLSTASANISKVADDPDIRESLYHLNNILKKIDDGNGTLGRLINDPTINDRILSLLGDEPRNRFLKPLLRAAIRQNEENQH